jgi:predicted CoA-substrate-specific enzyme activase
MILGSDVGTAYTKAVLMENSLIQYHTVVPTEANPDEAMDKVFANLWEEKRLRVGDLDEIHITGWGQPKVSLDHVSEGLMNCIGRGAVWGLPSCRSVLCLGCQQSVVLSVSPVGRVLEFRANDKCAAGAGRFLDRISGALEIDVERIAEVALNADKELNMSTQCAVFAESEVVTLANAGESVANILSAILHSLSRSVATLAKRITPEPDCVVAGGLANNETLVRCLKENLKKDLQVFQPRPDLIAAVGAALPAQGANR